MKTIEVVFDRQDPEEVTFDFEIPIEVPFNVARPTPVLVCPEDDE